jgi:hypothetical protein
MRSNDDKSRLERSLQRLGEWEPQLKIASLLRCALGERLCQEADDHPSLPASGGAYFYEAEYDSDPLSVEDRDVTDFGGGRAADWTSELASDWLSSQARIFDQLTQERLVSKSELVTWLRNVGAFVDDPRAWRGDSLPFRAVPWGLAAVLARRSLELDDAREAAQLLRDEAERGTLAFRDREEGVRWVFLRTTGDDSAGLLDLLEKLGGAEIAKAAHTEAVNSPFLLGEPEQPTEASPPAKESELIRLRHAELRRDDPDYAKILEAPQFGMNAARYIIATYLASGVTIAKNPKHASENVRQCELLINKYIYSRNIGGDSNTALRKAMNDAGLKRKLSDELLELLEQLFER